LTVNLQQRITNSHTRRVKRTFNFQTLDLYASADYSLPGGVEHVDQTRRDQREREQPKNTTRGDVLREEIDNSEETRGPEFSDRNHGLVREER
jgi:hypothetical protein